MIIIFFIFFYIKLNKASIITIYKHLNESLVEKSSHLNRLYLFLFNPKNRLNWLIFKKYIDVRLH